MRLSLFATELGFQGLAGLHMLRQCLWNSHLHLVGMFSVPSSPRCATPSCKPSQCPDAHSVNMAFAVDKGSWVSQACCMQLHATIWVFELVVDDDNDCQAVTRRTFCLYVQEYVSAC